MSTEDIAELRRRVSEALAAREAARKQLSVVHSIYAIADRDYQRVYEQLAQADYQRVYKRLAQAKIRTPSKSTS